MGEEVDADIEDEEKEEDSKQPRKKIPRKAAAKYEHSFLCSSYILDVHA